MGLPQIIINFKSAGTTAVRRSSRGNVALILEGTGNTQTFTSLSQAQASSLQANDLKAVELCFMGEPAKVTVIFAGSDESGALAQAARYGLGGWICAPGVESASLVAFIKEQRSASVPLRCVVANATAPNSEGIVNFCTAGIKAMLNDKEESVDTAIYACRIAGILAGLSLAQSATYYPLTEVTDFTESEDIDGDIDGGKLVLSRGVDGARIARAVTSLTTTTADVGEEFKKIKIAEAVDMIRSDIRSTFENYYIGKVINDYDSKLLLVTAINGYFSEIEGNVLDSSYENEARVDMSAQQAYLQGKGIDTSTMTDTEILSANTGSYVFLSASLRFVDAMEDLTFSVVM